MLVNKIKFVSTFIFIEGIASLIQNKYSFLLQKHPGNLT